MKKISISLFGPLQVRGGDGQLIRINGAKLQGLLAYLAMNIDMPPSRDRLMSVFWGERFSDQARQSLRQAISKLRKLLNREGKEVIWADNERVGLNHDEALIDFERFMKSVSDKVPEQDLAATLLFRDTLLDNVYVREAEFQDWLASERQRVITVACPTFERAVEHLVQKGDVEAALDLARRLVSLDNLRESSHRLLMRILAQNGQRAAAIQQYKTCAELLSRELDVEPGADTAKLLDEIRAVGLSPAPTMAASTAPSEPVAHETKPAAATRSSITVLPFLTLAPGAEQEFFADSLTQDITTALSKYRWLEVKASLTSNPGKLGSGEMQQIAGQQKIDFAILGNVRCRNNDLRLTVQLVELKSGRYLWVHRFDRVTDNLLDVQDELSDTIAASVEAELVRLEGMETRYIDEDQMTAWEFYHRGLAVQYEFSADANQQAQQYFRRASEMDPGFAAAFARLSYAMVISTIYFEAPDMADVLADALEHAKRSCRLDAQDAVGRFALGRVYLAMGEYDRSVTELQAAISLNPSMAQAHCGLGDSLTYAGNPEGAMPCFEEAVRLSPNDPYQWAFLSYGATALLFKGEFEEAAKWAGQASQVPNSHYSALAILASANGHMGKKAAAESALADLLRVKPDYTCEFARERLFYLRDPAQVDIYVDGLKSAGLA